MPRRIFRTVVVTQEGVVKSGMFNVYRIEWGMW